MPRVIITEDVGTEAGRVLVDAIEAVVQERGRCRLALSGGSDPGPVMEHLARHLPPARLPSLVVTWIDERHLGASRGADWHDLPEQSNQRLAWEHWFRHLSVPPDEVPMARSGSLPEATRAFAHDFADRIGRLDVALLGVGPDGHIASLFPGHPALEAHGVAVAVPDSPKPPPERISLTLPVLEDLDHAVLVASGEAKASVLQRARAGDRTLPLGRYQPRGAWTWVVDPAAGALLSADEDLQ